MKNENMDTLQDTFCIMEQGFCHKNGKTAPPMLSSEDLICHIALNLLKQEKNVKIVKRK